MPVGQPGERERETERERDRQIDRQTDRQRGGAGGGMDKQKAGDQAAIGTRAKRQSGDPCNNVCFVKTVSFRKS